ncbi:MAG: hypothetical protein HQK55_15980 [Deltaproteobacteria bacterium]|nr:hypothetical protein [Deltaproteobacteria bacterium]
MSAPFIEVSYFPGCSLATTARESNQSLVESCEMMGLKLIELDDWNCCGSSSAHALDMKLAYSLGARILSLAEPDRPLLVMCPACFKNLLSSRNHLHSHPVFRRAQERKWGRAINPELNIFSFLEILQFLDRLGAMGVAPVMEFSRKLSNLKIAPYYGCMAMFPSSLKQHRVSYDLLEKRSSGLGAELVRWAHGHRCCGTFLSVTKVDIATLVVNEIMHGAIDAGAECLVTACAMCQLNLEIRSTLKNSIPILHFSEILALALGAKDYQPWFSRHLVDPSPLLKEKGIIT